MGKFRRETPYFTDVHGIPSPVTIEDRLVLGQHLSFVEKIRSFIDYIWWNIQNSLSLRRQNQNLICYEILQESLSNPQRGPQTDC